MIRNQKFFSKLFCVPFSYCSITLVFKDSKSLKSDKRVEIKILFIFLLFDGWIRIRGGSLQIIPDPGGPKAYESGTMVLSKLNPSHGLVVLDLPLLIGSLMAKLAAIKEQKTT
jgi:hypothetical protein